jgi:hypothetical protein
MVGLTSALQGAAGYRRRHARLHYPNAKRIVVDSRLGPAQKASTIAHELGHVHCGHVDGDYAAYHRHRGRMESEVEAVAYLVTWAKVATKMQADSSSPGYIAKWSNGDAAIMHAAIDKAVSVSNKILDGCGRRADREDTDHGNQEVLVRRRV